MSSDDGFPAAGTPAATLLDQMGASQARDLDWRSGHAFSLVYHPDDEELEHLQAQVALRYLHENVLNPFKYPSLVEMEADVVSWGAALFGTDPRAGTMSSGGTESIFLAVHTARSVGDQRGVTRPNIVTPTTVHPAFAKACHYLRIEQRSVPVTADGRADAAAMAARIDDQTVLVVGSAPCYPYGVIDPIEELAAAAASHDTLCHVDACLGGWMLPWWEALGEDVPPWDFRVEGVTSLSADIHKYGYCFKGASLVMYREPEMVQHQWFVYQDWPGGLYGSITTAGTRPATPIAGAWATISHLGRAGYMAKAAQVRDATRAFRAAVEAQPALRLLAEPDMSVFAFGSDTLDMAAIGGVLDERGWNLDLQDEGLHLMVSPYHTHVTDRFAVDLADAVADHDGGPAKEAGYGGIADLA